MSNCRHPDSSARGGDTGRPIRYASLLCKAGKAGKAGKAEIDVFHFEELLRRRLDAFESSWLGKDEFEPIVVGSELEIVKLPELTPLILIA